MIVGFDLADDAGVVRLPNGQGLIQTLDFFTPVVDDARMFGAIAAANALSDVYAMGGVPLSAMNIVCFPQGDLPEWVLTEVLAGGAEKIAEAGAMLVGGHSVKDKELKYGLSVSGLVDLDAIWSNDGAQIGDVLFLTKPIGTGVLSTAFKRSVLTEADLAPAVRSMAALNKDAADAGREVGIHTATDVTGNGLVGHAMELARGSNVAIELNWSQIPLLPHARDAALAKHVPGGTHANGRYVGAGFSIEAGVPEEAWALGLDPQTSGGLLISVAAEKVEAMVDALLKRGLPANPVGRVLAGPASVKLCS